jgi:hypothetical protein
MSSLSSSARVASELRESTRQRLNSYALAASAAGVGMLALALPAEARIVYTSAHRVIKQGSSLPLDLNHDGVTDFTLQNLLVQGSVTANATFAAKPATGNGAEGWTGLMPYAFALKPGARIGSRHYFPGTVLAAAHEDVDLGTYYFGSWMNVKSRYLGLTFKINGKTHYGWARLSIQVQHLSITATLTGYAYETIPNTAIVAGQTTDRDEIGNVEPPLASSLPDPARKPPTLALLALGSPGLSLWQKIKPPQPTRPSPANPASTPPPNL